MIKTTAFTYNFPKYKFSKSDVMYKGKKCSDEDMISIQAAHALAEALEIADAVISSRGSKKSVMYIQEETLDTIHACETLLHILEVVYPDVPVDDAYEAVITKNTARGYYTDGARD